MAGLLSRRRAPPALRTFLLALAVADDLGAVVLIAALFTRELDAGMLVGALTVLALLWGLGRWRHVPAALFVAAPALVRAIIRTKARGDETTVLAKGWGS